MEKIRLSTVTPVYAGKETLADLISRIEELQNDWREKKAPMELIEAIFVNDASRDGSLEELYRLAKSKEWIRVINLSRNFGQHQATVAGILHSSGDWVITLDEDLQHDPQLVDGLLELAVTRKSDVVYANSNGRVHNHIMRDLSSRMFKKAVSIITGNRHVEKFSSFRLIRGSIARAASSICSHGPYFDVALCWFTDRVSSVNLLIKDIRYIESRKSGYTYRKLFSHAKRLIVSSEVKVLRLGAGIGLTALLFALILALKTLAVKVFNPGAIPVQGWTSLFLVSLFFGGLLAFMLGIILEYISIILLHIQGKPTFFTISRLSDDILQSYYQQFKERP